MSKILILSQLPPPVNGSTLITGIHIRVLEELGHHVTLISRKFSFQTKEIHKFTFVKVVKSFKLTFEILINFYFKKPEIYICYFSTSKYSSWIDLITCYIARLYGIRTILYFHTIPTRLFRDKGRLISLFSRLFSKAELVVLGDYMATKFKGYFATDNSIIIPNTIPSEFGNFRIGNEPRLDFSKKITFLSNLQPEKGLESFLKLCILIKSRNPDYRFRVIGPVVDVRYMEQIHKFIEINDLFKYVDFVGQLEGEDKYDALENSDFLVFTSELEEGQPLSILESLSVGTPVLSFPSGGAVDMIENGKTGFISTDLDELASKFFEFIEDFPSYLHIRSNCLNFYQNHHSLNKFTSNWAIFLSGKISDN